MHGVFDFRRYPWDEQEFSIQIEDANNDANELVYVADHRGSAIHPGVRVGNWDLAPARCFVHKTQYETDFGNPRRRVEKKSGEKAVYSRFCFVITANHRGIGIFLKTFLALFISVAIAFLTFAIRPADLDPRFGVGIAGIFGAVSSYIIMSQNTPETAQLTFGDELHLLAMFFIYLSLFESCISLRFHHLGAERFQKRLDNWSLVLFPFVFCLLVIVASVWAL